MNRLLADENLPLPVVEELRMLGYDVITLQEAGRGNQQFPDEKVLHLAEKQNRAVLTLNRKHFVRLHHLNEKATATSRDKMFEHDLKDYNDGQDYHWPIKRKQNGVKGGRNLSGRRLLILSI